MKIVLLSKKMEVMMGRIIWIAVFLASLVTCAQEDAFKAGESLEYIMSYSGFFKAGEASLNLEERVLDGKRLFHAKCTGKTSGPVSWFFKVDDNYQSYFECNKVVPYKFVRDVDEGGHLIRRDILFKEDKAYIKDYVKKNTSVKKAMGVQDMISAFYNLRNHDTSNMKKGDEIAMDIFFDGESFPFKLRCLGDEVLKTKIGKFKTQVFRPLVKSGRVFKENESVRVWVTADKNKIPVLIKADLTVGSVRVSIKTYKGLKYKLAGLIN